MKEFRYSEKYVLRFTMTMANAFNHPNFTFPANNISAPATVGYDGQPTPVDFDHG